MNIGEGAWTLFIGQPGFAVKIGASWHHYENHGDGRVVWRHCGVQSGLEARGARERDTNEAGELG